MQIIDFRFYDTEEYNFKNLKEFCPQLEHKNGIIQLNDKTLNPDEYLVKYYNNSYGILTKFEMVKNCDNLYQHKSTVMKSRDERIVVAEIWRGDNQDKLRKLFPNVKNASLDHLYGVVDLHDYLYVIPDEPTELRTMLGALFYRDFIKYSDAIIIKDFFDTDEIKDSIDDFRIDIDSAYQSGYRLISACEEYDKETDNKYKTVELAKTFLNSYGKMF